MSQYCTRWAILDGTQTTVDPLYKRIINSVQTIRAETPFNLFGPATTYYRDIYTPEGGDYSSTLQGLALLIVDDMAVDDSGGDLPTFDIEVVRYPGNYEFGYIPKTGSVYYNTGITQFDLKITQCYDGVDRVIRVSNVPGPIYGAYIEFTSTTIPNALNDPAPYGLGQICFLGDNSVITKIGTPSRSLGVWYSLGKKNSGVYEYCRSLEVEPIIIFDTTLSGSEYYIEGNLPTPAGVSFFPVPTREVNTQIQATQALYNSPLSILDILGQVSVDFPETVGQWIRGVYWYDPRPTDTAVFYGFLIEDSQTITDAVIRLMASLGVDMVQNYGEFELIHDSNRISCVNPVLEIKDDYISRKFNPDNGEEEPYYTLMINPQSDYPDEVRLHFKDAGRDSYPALAYFRNPFSVTAYNVQDMTTNAVMAFNTAQVLAAQLFQRAASRGKTYKLRLNYRVFGLIKLGRVITFKVVDSPAFVVDNNNPSYQVDFSSRPSRIVQAIITSMNIDENFNIEVDCIEWGGATPTFISTEFNYGSTNLPESIDVQATVLNIPIFDGDLSDTLVVYYLGTATQYGVMSSISLADSSISINSTGYTPLASSIPADIQRRGNWVTSNYSALSGCIDNTSILRFDGSVNDYFSSVNEIDLLAGYGTWLLYNNELIRAAKLTYSSGYWDASILLRGQCGTEVDYLYQGAKPVFLLSKVTKLYDTVNDLGVTKLLKVFAPQQNIEQTAAAPLTDYGLSATPYKVSFLGNDRQLNGNVNCYFSGHTIGNAKQVNGYPVIGISRGESYLIQIRLGAAILFETTQSNPNYTLTVAQVNSLGATNQSIGLAVSQLGDFGLMSPFVLVFTGIVA